MTLRSVIQTQGLTKHYRHPLFPWKVRARALTDLDLRIERGEVYGLLGPNGSGKSTAVKLILGLNFPTAGRVSVLGKPPSNRAIKERIGYLPEESYLYPFLSAREILDFYGRLFAMERRERKRRTASLLDVVGLSQEQHRPIAEFSKGMQRRVALAQSLINDPDIVILDEPTTGLDPVGIAEIKDLIRLLKRKGKTVLLCSHRLTDVEEVCDRVTILYGGRERKTDSVTALVRRERLVQVIAEMDEDTVEAVVGMIRQRGGEAASVEVHPASERLEKVFLQVVETAEEERAETSGVRAASVEKLDFLTRRDD